jgi:hypothetical protein
MTNPDPSLDCPNKQPRQKRCDCDTCIEREAKEREETAFDGFEPDEDKTFAGLWGGES